MKYSLRSLMVVATLVAIIIALTASIVIALGGGCKSPFTRMRVIQAEFSKLPPDDSALERWLLESPGVATAHVRRQSNSITITLIVRAGAPQLDDLPSKLAQLGYAGMKSYDPNSRASAP